MWVAFDLMGTLMWRDETTDDEIDIQVMKEFGYYNKEIEEKYKKVIKKVIKKMLNAPVHERAEKPHLFWIYLTDELGINIDEETLRKINDRFNEILLDHLFVNSRLLDLADSLKKAGVKTILITNSYRYLVSKIFHKFNELEKVFDHVFCADDTQMKKSEGAIEYVLNKLGLNQQDGIMIGDDEEEDGSHPEVLFLKVNQDWERYVKC